MPSEVGPVTVGGDVRGRTRLESSDGLDVGFGVTGECSPRQVAANLDDVVGAGAGLGEGATESCPVGLDAIPFS